MSVGSSTHPGSSGCRSPLPASVLIDRCCSGDVGRMALKDSASHCWEKLYDSESANDPKALLTSRVLHLTGNQGGAGICERIPGELSQVEMSHDVTKNQVPFVMSDRSAQRGSRFVGQGEDSDRDMSARERTTDQRPAETWSENKTAAESMRRSPPPAFASVWRVVALEITASPAAAWRPRSSPCRPSRRPAGGRPG
jgi:hypothetical protein